MIFSLMSPEQLQSIRRMARVEAEIEAIRIASDLVAAASNEHWTLGIVGATPCRYNPRLVGKTPSRWIVHTKGAMRNQPDAVIDGVDPIAIVDLLDRTAEWA